MSWLVAIVLVPVVFALVAVYVVVKVALLLLRLVFITPLLMARRL
jgi:hypothetical protein